jgi:predicted dehydrogenase
MNRSQIKTAVIGCGSWGGVHMQAYSGHPGSELVAVCDLDEQKAGEAAEKFHCRWTTDPMVVLQDDEIEAVSVATPDFAHAQVVLQAARAGKHILCEKPLSTDVGEARRMVKEAEKQQVLLMVDFHNRWNPAPLEAWKIIASGAFGRPLSASGHLANTLFVPKRLLSWSSKSGPEWFLFPHLVDLLTWFIGQKPVEVYAFGSKEILPAMGIDAYDSIQAMIRYPEASASASTCWILPESFPSLVDFRVHLFGTKGKIDLTLDRQGIEFTGQTYAWPFVLGQQDAHGASVGFAEQPVRHFVDCLLAGRAPVCTGEDGLINTATIHAILRSLDSGRTEKV